MVIQRSEFFIGLDLGQRRDFSVFTVLERYSKNLGYDPVYRCNRVEPRLALRMIDRLPLGTPYPQVVRRARELTHRAHAGGGSPSLIVDATNLGVPVVDALREAGLKGDLVPVTFTSGEHATRSSWGWNVPKHELVVGLKMMFDSGAIDIAAGLRLRAELIAELMQIGHDNRARAGHDDIVMSLALAAWHSRRGTNGERPHPLL